MAMSLEMPNKLHASGINNKEPPAIPEAPQAETAAMMLNNNAK